MPRHAPPLECSADDRAALIAIRKSRTEDTRVVERVKIVLARLSGKEIRQISRDMRVSVPTVTKWCKRFLLRGLKGLRDDPRPGKPARYDSSFREQVLNLLVHSGPQEVQDWDGPAIAKRLGASVDAVWRVLRREGIYLRRCRNWRIGTESGLVSKSTEVVGLYLNPPLNAVLLGSGEMRRLVDVDHVPGYVETDSGAVARTLERVRRHQGGLPLAAAIEAGAGRNRVKLTERQRRADFQRFLDGLIANQPKDLEIHGILDCGSSDRQWLAALEGRFKCHFTSTSAQWLHLIQIVFSLLHGTNAKRGDKTEEELRRAIEAFIRRHSEQTKPFRWRKGEIQYRDH
jgi:transposase